MEKNSKTFKTISIVTIVLFAIAVILDFINGDYAAAVVFAIAAVLDYSFVFKKTNNKDSKDNDNDSK